MSKVDKRMQDKKWLWILVLSVLSIGANFWGFPVYILDEAKNAACAMEMLQRSDWITPTFNGQLRTDKPPLHYFFMMVSYHLFGVSPFSARLFSVVMGILTVMMVYWFSRKMEGERTAFFSALVLVSSLYVTMQYHLAVPDPYFIFFLTASWLSFAYAYKSKRSRFYYFSYAAAALAFMAKGPAAVALTGPIFLAFLLIEKDNISWATLSRIRIGSGGILFLLIVAPWLVAVTYATDGVWLSTFIWGHNVGRFISPVEGHSGFPGQAILFFIVSLLPLSFYLPSAVQNAWKERNLSPLALMSLLAVAFVLLLFTFSRTLLPNYIGPAVPFGAILIGRLIDRKLSLDSTTGKAWKIGSAVALMVVIIAPFALRQAILADRWIGDLPHLAWLFMTLPLGALIALVFVFNNKLREALISYLLSFWLLGMLFFYQAAPEILARNPVEVSLPMIRDSGREVVCYYFFNSAYIFAFQSPLPTFHTPQNMAAYSSGKPVIILTRKDYEAELVAVGFRVIFEKPYLFEQSVAIVMVNDPKE